MVRRVVVIIITIIVILIDSQKILYQNNMNLKLIGCEYFLIVMDHILWIFYYLSF